MDDLKLWNDNLDKQIAIREANCKKHYKACNNCGDSGFTLCRASSSVGYDSLNLVYCHCATGQNLMERFTRKDLNGKE